MNPYTEIKNYKPSNIRFYLQGKWRAFIIRQYNKLNLPESSIFQRIVKYEKYLGNCPYCGCPMSEILLTDKECEPDNYIMGPDPYTTDSTSNGLAWQIKNGSSTIHEVSSPLTLEKLDEFMKDIQKTIQHYDKRKL